MWKKQPGDNSCKMLIYSPLKFWRDSATLWGMKEFFTPLGIPVSYQQEAGFRPLSLQYLCNRDGSIRWIWNAANRSPLFLKFYSVSSFRSRIYALGFRMLFLLRLQGFFFKKTTLYTQVPPALFFDPCSEWALFTGTVGPNNKMLLYSQGYFYKIPVSSKSEHLLANELDALKNLESTASFIYPKAEKIHNILKLQDLSCSGKRSSQFSETHGKVLRELSSQHTENIRISEWPLFQKTKTDLERLNDERIPFHIQRKLKWIIEDLCEDEEVPLSFAHGDFTAWNMYVKNEQLALFDWELSSRALPKGFDFFHFIIQNGILLERKRWKELYLEILRKNKLGLRIDSQELHRYLKYYLIINTVQYLKIYSEQKKWHIQIHWLLETWNEALNPYLKEQFSSRQLLMMDLFDRLTAHKYAALKLSETLPECISADADIDLLVGKEVSKDIISFLEKHSLVEKMQLNRKSFMKNITLLTPENEILSVDCIEQLKWKNLIIGNIEDWISRAVCNSYGIWKTSDKDTRRFILLFYTLNNSGISEKYLNFLQESYASNTFNERYLPYTQEQTRRQYKKLIVDALKKDPRNRGLRHLLNTVKYAADLFSSQGFTVTFSGVDGAGKSTVISEIGTRIEKRFRRPVKVLRHRPSLLPILSVWVKGKKKAHMDVVSTLPRQGKNSGKLSSLLRFSYYYADYLFGQWVIYLKYILRGYIVIYDRYYFDFIADARRSNITLPRSIAILGYSFLMKPRFNFFLYEDPEVILKRKQELSSKTITKLTHEYRHLFSSLEESNSSAVYESIKNRELQETLNHILNTLTKAL